MNQRQGACAHKQPRSRWLRSPKSLRGGLRDVKETRQNPLSLGGGRFYITTMESVVMISRELTQDQIRVLAFWDVVPMLTIVEGT